MMVAALTAYTTIPWWVLAVVLGGFIFGWDWLWGDVYLLRVGIGWLFIMAGAVGLVVSYLLALRLGLGIPEFLALASGAARRARWLYNLPAVAVAGMVYGVLILSTGFLSA